MSERGDVVSLIVGGIVVFAYFLWKGKVSIPGITINSQTPGAVTSSSAGNSATSSSSSGQPQSASASISACGCCESGGLSAAQPLPIGGGVSAPPPEDLTRWPMNLVAEEMAP